jgi:hypothetical protein
MCGLLFAMYSNEGAAGEDFAHYRDSHRRASTYLVDPIPVVGSEGAIR